MRDSIAEDCGRFFEVGFNTGILTYIHQHPELFVHQFDHMYADGLRQLSFPAMVRSSFKRGQFSSASFKRQIVEQWFLYFLQKGYLAGLNFFQEYLQSLRWQKETARLEITYYQCNFANDNSIFTFLRNEDDVWRSTLAQLVPYKVDSSQVALQRYSGKGGFLHADTLMLCHYGSKWRILCVDLSIFSVTSSADLKDPNGVDILRRLLLRDISYIRSKSVFTNLSIDTSDNDAPDFSFSKGLETYFTAFKHKDKESAKLIQAGSYAYNFYTFLTDFRILPPNDDVLINIVGYSDRGINAMSVSEANLKILQTCSDIYRKDSNDLQIEQARINLLQTIQRNAARSFQDGETFTSAITGIKQEGGPRWIASHRECVESFTGLAQLLPLEKIDISLIERLGLSEGKSISIRNAHAHLVQQELDVGSENPYIFLTGNPGIGKTTAIVNFLLEHREEGFLFLYISPRKQVNLDIIDKFREDETKALPIPMLALTSNSAIITRNHGKPTVHYYASHRTGNFRRQGIKTPIDFIDAEDREDVSRPRQRQRIVQINDHRLQDQGMDISGVLKSVCQALHVSVKEPLSNQLIATIAIQSLKKTGNGKDTLEHLKSIFLDAYNSRENVVIAGKMRAIANRMKHIFIMIDEITGDESGVEFLAGIHRFVAQFKLTDPSFGFNTKIIVADASIVDRQVIERHLVETTYEPDKIYFRRVVPDQIPPPLAREELTFKGRSAVLINANSYPASRLFITYKICMDVVKFDEDTYWEKKDQLTAAVQTEIEQNLLALMQSPDIPQIIVYIQDKKRLSKLIDAIRQKYDRFAKYEDYLEIHANLSEAEKKHVEDKRQAVRVVFMTSSASRGLSFPKATHILVDIPHFEIEQNLMEIIQVIYRGRGGDMDDREKELYFYLSDQAIYSSEEDKQLSLCESSLNLLNILLILKTSIMTRIQGYGHIGRQRFMMIPIGGKSVIAAGETLTGALERLIRDLRDEYHRHYDKPWLRDVYMELQSLLGQADFWLSTAASQSAQQSEMRLASLLSLRKSLSIDFANSAAGGFHLLLDRPMLEPGYITGGLVIVPLQNKRLQEDYFIELERKLRRMDVSELHKKMGYISVSNDYHDNLRLGVQTALNLIDQLQGASPDKTQQFTQESQNLDQYYAVPLFMFPYGNVIREYLSEHRDDSEDASFRVILAGYIRALFPATGILPIGDQYQEFPFILFRSYNLAEARSRAFSKNHLLISHEMNILNMILSYRE